MQGQRALARPCVVAVGVVRCGAGVTGCTAATVAGVAVAAGIVVIGVAFEDAVAVVGGGIG